MRDTEMATSRLKNGKYRYTVRRKKLLPKPINLSFENKEEGDAYCASLEDLLDRGIVPAEYLEQKIARKLHDIIDEYIRIVDITIDNKKLLYVQKSRLENITTDLFLYDWCENWVRLMKSQYKLAPSTIRKHVGALARCMDWAVNKEYILINYLRRLPVGYATYTENDVRLADIERFDIERDRRLDDGEEDKIRLVLSGRYEKPDDKQRFIEVNDPDAMILMFDLAVETAMRLSEIYTLERSQIKLKEQTINLTETKNGENRQVPMSTPCKKALKKYLDKHTDKYLFPWFRGIRTKKELKSITSTLSSKWKRIFEHAECVDLHFHDLRHEATSRVFERTNLSDIEISKITGHKTLKMLARYANLRASNLAMKLW